MTDTEAERTELAGALSSSFAGVADVGVGTDAEAAAANSGGSFTAVPALASGFTSTHFWITASYADMTRGAIWGAVQACRTRVPGWLCSYAGNLLSSWAAGWGSASNHGVWAAVYYNGSVTGGRW